MSSNVSSFSMQNFTSIGSKTSISQHDNQGKVKYGHVLKHSSTKKYPAKHNFEINDQKIIDKIRITMQKNWRSFGLFFNLK
jgi:hypothetical protein